MVPSLQGSSEHPPICLCGDCSGIGGHCLGFFLSNPEVLPFVNGVLSLLPRNLHHQPVDL